VDHGLRVDGAADVATAGRLAAALRLPFVGLRVKVARGASLQAQARAARYAALQACAAERGAERVAVGHTLDDQAETVLARLLRGASIEGLAAIAPLRSDGVVRPLIDCPRGEVEAYIAQCGLETARDPSNRDERYLRVRIRNRLLPALCEENPKLAQQLASLSDDAREAARVLADQGARALARTAGQAALLREEPVTVRRWAIKQLVEQGAGGRLERAHLTALDRMLWIGGQVRVPGDRVVAVDTNGVLFVSAVTKRGRGSARRSEKAE